MKFSVLIGLIRVGELSNREVIETVLNLVREKASTRVPRSMACWTEQRVTCPRAA
jgi:hypothetical protein